MISGEIRVDSKNKWVTVQDILERRKQKRVPLSTAEPVGSVQMCSTSVGRLPVFCEHQSTVSLVRLISLLDQTCQKRRAFRRFSVSTCFYCGCQSTGMSWSRVCSVESCSCSANDPPTHPHPPPPPPWKHREQNKPDTYPRRPGNAEVLHDFFKRRGLLCLLLVVQGDLLAEFSRIVWSRHLPFFSKTDLSLFFAPDVRGVASSPRDGSWEW